MCDVSTWNAICARCEEVYEKRGSSHPIPTTLSDNPHQVFLDTHVEVNVGRFVVFILWLKQQPFAFGWYEFIRRNHPAVFEDCLIQLSFL